MKPTRTTAIILLLLIFSVLVNQAQDECIINIQEIVDSVTAECEGIGQNQVCYGNRNVVATPRLNVRDFVFEEPGDIVDLSNVESLFVSEIDPTNNEWGVAQMRLQVSSETGNQDMTMLLFGAFSVENAVEATQTVPVRVRSRSTDIRSTPNPTALILESPVVGTQLLAHGRLDDSSWLRVENEATGIVGWVTAITVEPVNASASVGVLPVQDANSPYYGAMQAFYFSSGSTDIGCDNLASDGLLIQTPEGVARVSLLINEVSIELTGTGSGTQGTAYIEANPENEDGMEVSVLEGQAEVSTSDGSSQTVNQGQQSNVPLNEDGVAEGAPTIPISFDLSSINFSILMPTFSTGSSTDENVEGSGNGSVNLTSGNANGNSENSNGGSGNGSNNPGSSGSSNSGGGNTGTSGGLNTSAGGTNNGSSAGGATSIEDIQATQQALASPPQWTQGNILALSLALVAAALVIGGIVFYTVSNKRR
jgi:hypothetical protein